MEKSKTFIAKPSLGKGLASLLPPLAPPPPNAAMLAAMAEEPTDSNRDRHLGISMAIVDEIQVNQYQPRKNFDDQTIEELAQSIKANGLIQPLIVRKTSTGNYQLIAGERRLRAAKLAGLKQVPIVIRRTTDREALELALIENIQREDLNCMDTAAAYYQLINDFDLKQEELSARVGKDRTSVTNYLRLLKLPASVQVLLKEAKISFGHGKALGGLEDPIITERVANECVEKKWSVREIETQIQRLKNLQAGHESRDLGEPTDPVELRLKNIGRDLSAKFATKVQVRGDAVRGRIVIEYFTSDDLERVLTQILSTNGR